MTVMNSKFDTHLFSPKLLATPRSMSQTRDCSRLINREPQLSAEYTMSYSTSNGINVINPVLKNNQRKHYKAMSPMKSSTIAWGKPDTAPQGIRNIS